MARFSKRQVALMAELLADELLRVYQSEQVPAMVESFASAGFTRTALQQDPVRLFQMLVTAAYDRRPFTPAAGGSEVIWGMGRRTESIPRALESLSLFTPVGVRSLSEETIHRQLDGQIFFGRSLASDGDSVRFARTLLDLARLIERDLHAQMLRAQTAQDVQSLYNTLIGVHGIGDTIGAKLIKYLLREIGAGRVPTSDFPLMVVWPIADEYHANEAVEHLSVKLDRSLVPLAIGLLLKRGEPFAIDALFYLHRHRSWALDEFVRDAQALQLGQRAMGGTSTVSVKQAPDAEVAHRLLAVIKEIYEGSRGITPVEIKRANLHGVVTPEKIETSARWLHTEMGQLAAKGNAAEMVTFYHNCLRSEDGKLIGWALQQLGRPSMESEKEHFLAIYKGRS